MSFKTIVQSMRPPFLLLTPVCVFLGVSTALTSQTSVDMPMLIILMLGALAAHISVNMLNEYGDFQSGLDLKTVKTPFSGGSGALPNKPEAAKAVLILGIVMLGLTIAIGLYFMMVRGRELLPIGILGVVLVVSYTKWLNRSPWLCLIAPGLGFGVLMVIGSHLVMAAPGTAWPWLQALVPFFLVNNLLLLNQYPDVDADASVGRNTFPIAFGIVRSNVVYAIFTVSAYSLILIGIVSGALPGLSVIALLPIIPSSIALYGAVEYLDEIGKHPQFMAANVVATLTTPLLLAIAMVWG